MNNEKAFESAKKDIFHFGSLYWMAMILADDPDLSEVIGEYDVDYDEILKALEISDAISDSGDMYEIYLLLMERKLFGFLASVNVPKTIQGVEQTLFYRYWIYAENTDGLIKKAIECCMEIRNEECVNEAIKHDEKHRRVH